AGPESWGERREVLIKTFLKHDPDILGLQEVSPAQGAFLLQKLQGMKLAPRGDVGASLGLVTDLVGTLNPIYYPPQRWTLISSSSGPVRPEAQQEPLTENAYFCMAVLRDNNHVLPDLIVIDTHLRHGIPNAVAGATKLHEMVAQQQKQHPGAQAIV